MEMCVGPLLFGSLFQPLNKHKQVMQHSLTHPFIPLSANCESIGLIHVPFVNLHVSDFLIKHVLYSLFINISHKLILMQIAKIRKATLFMEPPKPQIQNTNCKRRIKSLTIHQKEKYKTKHIYNYMSHLIVFPQGRA